MGAAKVRVALCLNDVCAVLRRETDVVKVAIIYSIGGFHFTKRILSVSAVRILMYDRVAFMCVADNLQGASCSLPMSVRVGGAFSHTDSSRKLIERG
jgi:hypothetical protein